MATEETITPTTTEPEKSLQEKIASTKQAITDVKPETVEKGNTIEQAMREAEQGVNGGEADQVPPKGKEPATGGEPVPPKPKEPKGRKRKYRKSSRKRKSTTERNILTDNEPDDVEEIEDIEETEIIEEPQEPRPDPLMGWLNGGAGLLAQKVLHKKPEDIQLNEKQQKAVAALRPQGSFMDKPSYWTYAIAAVGYMFENFTNANKKPTVVQLFSDGKLVIDENSVTPAMKPFVDFMKKSFTEGGAKEEQTPNE